MTPLEKIDFVFFYIKEHTQFGGSVSEFAIQDRVKKTPETKITPTLLKEIINRLKTDKFITELILPEAQPVYHSTFEGVLILGYKMKAFNERVKNILYSVSLVAVIIAGLYYLIEVYKDLTQLSC